jgi:acyl-CoA thioesterase FadM
MRWMEATELAFLKSMGINGIESHAAGLIGWPKVNVTCDYEAPLYFEDEVQINFTVIEVKTHSIRF